jgi:hypothetical protein
MITTIFISAHADAGDVEARPITRLEQFISVDEQLRLLLGV